MTLLFLESAVLQDLGGELSRQVDSSEVSRLWDGSTEGTLDVLPLEWEVLRLVLCCGRRGSVSSLSTSDSSMISLASSFVSMQLFADSPPGHLFQKGAMEGLTLDLPWKGFSSLSHEDFFFVCAQFQVR